MTDPLPKPPQDEEDLPEPPQVRRLRRLVSALTLASIVAVLAIAGTVVIRLSTLETAPRPAVPGPVAMPEAIALPRGETITALGAAGSSVLIATTDAAGVERLRSFDADTGAALSVTVIDRR
ncbi:MAG: DUF6476 family protein [Pseudomonadota bacterium]